MNKKKLNFDIQANMQQANNGQLVSLDIGAKFDTEENDDIPNEYPQ